MAEENRTAPAPEQDIHEQKRIRMEKLDELKADGRDPFTITKFDVTAKADAVKRTYTEQEAAWKEQCGEDEEAFQARLETLKEQPVTIAGRMMSKRGMGRAVFLDLQDSTDRIQVYVRVNDIGKELFKEFKKWDIGDIIGVKGFVFRTKMGEISIHAQEITLLSKALLPLPEKWHGLKNQDTRYRKRYLDLIVNPDVKQTFVTRSRILREIRDYLDNLGYVEVETPVLLPIQIAAAAKPFITYHNTLDMRMYLRIETELNLKKLIVGGFDRVYEVGRIFRNEGMDPSHNPEFTSIEMYQAYTDYKGMMDLIEEMYRSLAKKICGILTEGSLSCEMGCLDYAVLGIGVNVRQTQQQFPEELLPIVTSVEEVCGKVVPRSQLAAEILNQLEPLLPNPTAEEVLEEYRERSFLTGRKVSILQGGQARTAQVLGIDRKGRLVVQEEDGSRQALVSADRVLPLAKG